MEKKALKLFEKKKTFLNRKSFVSPIGKKSRTSAATLKFKGCICACINESLIVGNTEFRSCLFWEPGVQNILLVSLLNFKFFYF